MRRKGGGLVICALVVLVVVVVVVHCMVGGEYEHQMCWICNSGARLDGYIFYKQN